MCSLVRMRYFQIGEKIKNHVIISSSLILYSNITILFIEYTFQVFKKISSLLPSNILSKFYHSYLMWKASELQKYFYYLSQADFVYLLLHFHSFLAITLICHLWYSNKMFFPTFQSGYVKALYQVPYLKTY